MHFFGDCVSPPLRAFLAILLLTTISVTAPTTGRADNSQVMPLAQTSLLLDGQVIGERIIVVGERGHILVSEDQGRSWRQQLAPTRSTLTSVFFIDPDHGWAAGHDSVILQTRDGGRQWQEIYADAEDERPILDLWFKDRDQGYAAGAYGLFMMTEDGGATWQQVDFSPASLNDDGSVDAPSAEDTANVPVDFHLNQIAATPEGRLFIAAEAGNLYRSDDEGLSWLSLPSPYEGSFYGSLPLDADTLLAFGLRGHLFRSVDAGKDWTEIDTAVQATLNDGVRLRDGRIVLAGLAGTLLSSSDNGLTFQLQPLADRIGIAKILQAGDGALIVIGEAGVKRLELAGLTAEEGR